MSQYSAQLEFKRIASKNTTGFFTYIVRCADNSLYTGWTVDLGERSALTIRGAAPSTLVDADRLN